MTSDNIKKRESPFVLRTAQLEDLDKCVELALMIPLDNDPNIFPPSNELKVRETLTSLIEGQTLIIYENNGILVGILGIVVDTFWWSEKPYIMDMLFYIKPEFRSHSTYKRMLSAVEAFGKINQLPIALLFFTTKDVKRKFKLLARKGYKPAGFWVVKDKVL